LKRLTPAEAGVEPGDFAQQAENDSAINLANPSDERPEPRPHRPRLLLDQQPRFRLVIDAQEWKPPYDRRRFQAATRNRAISHPREFGGAYRFHNRCKS
jgi:hypothetical protein